MASPVSPNPVITLKTPSGIPASLVNSASLIAVSGDCSAGFNITEQPAAKAGAAFQAAISKGKFQGTTRPTTPIGSFTMKLETSCPVGTTLPKVLSINSPYH